MHHRLLKPAHHNTETIYRCGIRATRKVYAPTPFLETISARFNPLSMHGYPLLALLCRIELSL